MLFEDAAQVCRKPLATGQGNRHLGDETLYVGGEPLVVGAALVKGFGMGQVCAANGVLPCLDVMLPIARFRQARGLCILGSVGLLEAANTWLRTAAFDLMDTGWFRALHLAAGLPGRCFGFHAKAAHFPCEPLAPLLEVGRARGEALAIGADSSDADMDVRVLPVVVPGHQPSMAVPEGVSRPSASGILHAITRSAGRHGQDDVDRLRRSGVGVSARLDLVVENPVVMQAAQRRTIRDRHAILRLGYQAAVAGHVIHVRLEAADAAGAAGDLDHDFGRAPRDAGEAGLRIGRKGTV